jgi:hypothetical protein
MGAMLNAYKILAGKSGIPRPMLEDNIKAVVKYGGLYGVVWSDSG